MDLLIKTLTKLGLLKEDLDYHLIRASMVINMRGRNRARKLERDCPTLVQKQW